MKSLILVTLFGSASIFASGEGLNSNGPRQAFGYLFSNPGTILPFLKNAYLNTHHSMIDGIARINEDRIHSVAREAVAQNFRGLIDGSFRADVLKKAISGAIAKDSRISSASQIVKSNLTTERLMKVAVSSAGLQVGDSFAKNESIPTPRERCHALARFLTAGGKKAITNYAKGEVDAEVSDLAHTAISGFEYEYKRKWNRAEFTSRGSDYYCSAIVVEAFRKIITSLNN